MCAYDLAGAAPKGWIPAARARANPGGRSAAPPVALLRIREPRRYERLRAPSLEVRQLPLVVPEHSTVDHLGGREARELGDDRLRLFDDGDVRRHAEAPGDERQRTTAPTVLAILPRVRCPAVCHVVTRRGAVEALPPAQQAMSRRSPR
eukprot:3422307-Pleurochrysis_carterae.AAC.2